MSTYPLALVSVWAIANDIWFNTHNLNCRLWQLRVLAKVVVLWNMGKWDSLIVGTPPLFQKKKKAPTPAGFVEISGLYLQLVVV